MPQTRTATKCMCSHSLQQANSLRCRPCAHKSVKQIRDDPMNDVFVFVHGALSLLSTRDTWHKTAQDGDTVEGFFYKLKWTHTPGEVKAFEHDGAWEFQDAPQGAPAGWCWWTGAGKDKSGKKTEVPEYAVEMKLCTKPTLLKHR